MHPIATVVLRMIVVGSLLSVSCKGQMPKEVNSPVGSRIHVEDELLVLKVVFPKEDLSLWEDSVGQEIMPNFILVSFYIREANSSAIFAVFALRSRESLERSAQDPPRQEEDAQLEQANAVHGKLRIQHSYF
jgi:hypothetical protein